MFTRWQFSTLVALGALALAGCGKLEPGRTGGPLGNEAQTATDMAANLDGGGNAGAPANNQAGNNQPADKQPAKEANPNSPDKGTYAPMPREDTPGSIVHKKVDRILDAAKLKNDPKSQWTIIADNPAEVKARTLPGTVYQRAAALSTVGITQHLKAEHALHGKYPSYDELMEWHKTHVKKMPALPPERAYGYDETTGQMVILEWSP